MPRGRLKVLRPPLLHRLGRLLLLPPQILQIRLAKSTADLPHVKLDVLRVASVEGAQQIAAELLAAGAREPLPPPDLPHAVYPGIAPRVDRSQLLEQLRLLAQLHLDRRHLRR